MQRFLNKGGVILSTQFVKENNDLPDEQKTQETRKVYLRHVGIKDIVVPVTYIFNGEVNSSVANMMLSVDLAADKRAIHMSRLVESVNEWDRVIDDKPIQELLGTILNRLDGFNAYAEIDFIYFILKKAPVSENVGRMNYQCKVKASLEKTKPMKIEIEVKVPITSVCPCSKSISEYGAHNQRGLVSVVLKNTDVKSIPDIIRRVEESASFQLFSLLKRVDEKYVTEHAYENAKFVEDIARDVTINLRENSQYSDFSVNVENFESIHNHNAYAIMVSNDLVEVNE